MNMKILLLPLILLATACTQIDTGNVGVSRTLGKVSPDPVNQGVYFTLFKSIDEFTTKEVSFALTDMRPKSQDNLTMQDVDVDIYFKVAPAAIPGLVIKYQGDVVRHRDVVEGGTSDLVVAYNRVLREARESVYKSVADFPSQTMHTKRADLSEAIRVKLQADLDKSDKGSFTITSINVRNLVTDPAIEAAIQQKSKTEQAIQNKQLEIDLAKAEAERLSVVALGQAKANEIISASLTDKLVKVQEIEANRDAIVSASAKAGNTVFVGSIGANTVLPIR